MLYNLLAFCFVSHLNNTPKPDSSQEPGFVFRGCLFMRQPLYYLLHRVFIHCVPKSLYHYCTKPAWSTMFFHGDSCPLKIRKFSRYWPLWKPIQLHWLMKSGHRLSIPNFIVDPTPLFLRENKPRRFLEPCYCIMGRLVSQERNRNLFSLFQNDPQGFPSASPLFYHTFLLSSIKKDEPLLRMTHFNTI